MPRLPIFSLLFCLAATPATAGGVLYAKTSTTLGTSIVTVDPVTGVTRSIVASGLGPIDRAAVGNGLLYFVGGGVVGTVGLRFPGLFFLRPLSQPIVPENLEYDAGTNLLIARVAADIVSVSPETGIVKTIAAGAVTQPNAAEGLSINSVILEAYVDDGGTIKTIDILTGHVTPSPAPVGGVVIGARRDPPSPHFSPSR